MTHSPKRHAQTGSVAAFSYYLRVRFFGKIRKRICHPRSYGFFDTKETQNPKKDYFAITRQAGGTQYICQNDISLVLPKNSTRMEYK